MEYNGSFQTKLQRNKGLQEVFFNRCFVHLCETKVIPNFSFAFLATLSRNPGSFMKRRESFIIEP